MREILASNGLRCWNGEPLLVGNGDSTRWNRADPVMNSAEAGMRLRLRARIRKTTPIMATTRKTTPPTTPPAIAATGRFWATKVLADMEEVDAEDNIVVPEPFDDDEVSDGSRDATGREVDASVSKEELEDVVEKLVSV